MTFIQFLVIDDILNERTRQNEKFMRPDGWHDDDFVKLAVLTEEVGEVAQEVLRIRYEQHTPVNLRAELIQVAAVALAWLEMLPTD